MFWFQRPKPKLQVGSIVESIPAKIVERRYLLITYRQWAVPLGGDAEQWVYDGQVLRPHDGHIELRGHAFSQAEDSLEYVCGPKVA